MLSAAAAGAPAEEEEDASAADAAGAEADAPVEAEPAAAEGGAAGPPAPPLGTTADDILQPRGRQSLSERPYQKGVTSIGEKIGAGKGSWFVPS